MNDQRQVIFSQRLKILKENNISIIIKDFFDEVLKDLQISRSNYQKSNDEKYITDLKNITGNVLNDSELIKFMSQDSANFF